MTESGHTTEQDNASPSFSVPRARACEACRSRKIRCDKKLPCSNCRQLKIPCRAAKPPAEKRQRVLISGRYEEQVERIYTHIQRLEATLQELLERDRRPTARNSPNTFSPALPSKRSSSSSPQVASSADEISYQGEPSFEVNSELTSQLLDSALSHASSSQETQETSTALNNLYNYLKTHKASEAGSFNHDMALPSLDLTLKALRLAGSLRHTYMLAVMAVDVARLKEFCQKVYFPVESYSLSDFIIVNGGVSYVLNESTKEELRAHDIDPDEADEACNLCVSNVENALSQLSPFLSGTVANIAALNIATQMAMEESKPAMAWNLISYAARLCLNAGIHRLKKTPDDPDYDVKVRLFWSVYALEKGLSLNFGLTPNIPDFDVTLEYPTYPECPFLGYGHTWIDLAKTQSKIYEKLYSGTALLQSVEKRASMARNLGLELQDMLRRCRELWPKIKDGDPHVLNTVESMKILMYTNLTLVYRTIPTSGSNHPLLFNDECVAAARKSLQLHIELINRLIAQDDFSLRLYIDWSLMFCPFTPFNVILGTAIMNTSLEDMNLLNQALLALEVTGKESPGARRLFDICNVLFKGAKAIMEQNLNGSEHSQAAEEMNYDIGPSFAPLEPRMSEMQAQVPFQRGLIRNDVMALKPSNSHQAVAPVTLDTTGDMSMLYDNFLTGNAGMMDLFEGDFGTFEFQ